MKLFKNLRQYFIEKKDIKRYVLYAIGEIFLVMVGISLAFQVDNWNEERIKRSNEIGYYRNIRDQILDDQELIKSQIKYNNRYASQFTYAFDIIEANDKSKMDTLGIIIRNMTQYSDFDREGNIYESLVNSGEIKILKNNHIVRGIRELEERYIYVNRIESIHYDAMMNHTVTAINPIIKFSTAEIKRQELVFNYEFQNLFVVLLQIMKEKDEVYHNALNQIDLIKKLIDEELESSSN